MFLEGVGVILALSMVGFLWRIAFQAGQISTKLAVVCDRLNKHDERIEVLEDRND